MLITSSTLVPPSSMADWEILTFISADGGSTREFDEEVAH